MEVNSVDELKKLAGIITPTQTPYAPEHEPIDVVPEPEPEMSMSDMVRAADSAHGEYEEDFEDYDEDFIEEDDEWENSGDYGSGQEEYGEPTSSTIDTSLRRYMGGKGQRVNSDDITESQMNRKFKKFSEQYKKKALRESADKKVEPGDKVYVATRDGAGQYSFANPGIARVLKVNADCTKAMIQYLDSDDGRTTVSVDKLRKNTNESNGQKGFSVTVDTRDASKANDIAKDMFRGAYKNNGSTEFLFKDEGDRDEFLSVLNKHGLAPVNETAGGISREFGVGDIVRVIPPRDGQHHERRYKVAKVVQVNDDNTQALVHYRNPTDDYTEIVSTDRMDLHNPGTGHTNIKYGSGGNTMSQDDFDDMVRGAEYWVDRARKNKGPTKRRTRNESIGEDHGNLKLHPESGEDRAKLLAAAKDSRVSVIDERDENGCIVLDTDYDSLDASAVLSRAKRKYRARFKVVSPV